MWLLSAVVLRCWASIISNDHHQLEGGKVEMLIVVTGRLYFRNSGSNKHNKAPKGLWHLDGPRVYACNMVRDPRHLPKCRTTEIDTAKVQSINGSQNRKEQSIVTARGIQLLV